MKRLFNIFTLCSLISLFTISCKKDHLTTQTNGNPIFYFTGSIGGNAMDLRAGVNNYYMYSSYTQDGNGVYNYTGTLKEYNCSINCPPSIEFIINDYRSLAVGASENNIGQSLANGYLNYFVPGGTPTSFSMTFSPTQNNSIPIKNYTWNFGDGTVITFTSQTLSTISHTYSHAGNYNASLSVLFTDTTSNSLTNGIQMGNNNVVLNCSITVSGNSFTANPSGGSGNYSFNWNFGDSSNINNDTSSSQHPTYNYVDTSSQHTVTVIMTDTISKKSITAKTYVATSYISQTHLFNYHTSAPTSAPNAFGLSNITVIYTDASGDQYTSNNPSQPDSSYFHVISVSNYQNNENNQSTKQLHAKFDCMLFDGTGKQLAIKNGEAVFAVAYK